MSNMSERGLSSFPWVVYKQKNSDNACVMVVKILREFQREELRYLASNTNEVQASVDKCLLLVQRTGCNLSRVGTITIDVT